MDNEIKCTQTFIVRVTGDEGDKKLAVQAQECPDCCDYIVTDDFQCTPISQMREASTVVKFVLADDCQAKYEMVPITCVLNIYRTDVINESVEPSIAILNPEWKLTGAADFSEFATSKQTDSCVEFQCIKLPPEGTEHACKFDLNVRSKSGPKTLDIVQYRFDENPLSTQRVGLFRLNTISHDPIIIVGKPK